MKCGGEGTRPVPVTVVDECYGMVAVVDVDAVGGAVETVVVCGTPVVVTEDCVVVGTTVVELVVV